MHAPTHARTHARKQSNIHIHARARAQMPMSTEMCKICASNNPLQTHLRLGQLHDPLNAHTCVCPVNLPIIIIPDLPPAQLALHITHCNCNESKNQWALANSAAVGPGRYCTQAIQEDDRKCCPGQAVRATHKSGMSMDLHTSYLQFARFMRMAGSCLFFFFAPGVDL